jgi:hypothetical protein
MHPGTGNKSRQNVIKKSIHADKENGMGLINQFQTLARKLLPNVDKW